MNFLSEEGRALIRERDTLSAAIADSYVRMGTNTSPVYRAEQMEKCNRWLDALSALYEKDPYHYSLHPAKLL